jgi:DNA-binding YbaB/EbfC family protein
MSKGRKGFPGGMGPMGGMGGMNMNSLVKQAQQVQRNFEEQQAALAEKRLEVSAGGGAVQITIKGNRELEKISISKDVVDPEDVEMLEDLILASVNEALRQVEELSQGELSRLTGGLNLPNGLF